MIVRCAVLATALAAPALAATRPITVEMDARRAPQKMLHGRLTMPVAPGPLTLLYPKWLPGEHAPDGPIVDVAGLKMSAGGRAVAWRRDPVEMHAFHVEVPAGADTLEIDLDYLSPAAPGQFTSGVSMTSQLAVLGWNQVLLYPKGARSDELTYAASLRLPAGWKYGTALATAGEADGLVTFAPVSLTTLVDSPVLSGANFRTVPLATGPIVQIHMAADSAEALEMSPEVKGSYERLVAEAYALFGAHHYRAYSFLLTLSDHVQSFGLEHHESSDNRISERAIVDEAPRTVRGGLLPHEYVHSWNGKYRRPQGLATDAYDQPMEGELLWVYEGLTSYLGEMLTSRSGLRSDTDARDNLASIAAGMQAQRGRTWRPLVDTAVSAPFLYRGRGDGKSWRRGVDFYGEGLLLWLEADVLIRRETRGARSLDDFCRRFYGGESGAPRVVPYTFDDLVAALQAVAPYDWRGFWKTRLESTSENAPLAGLTGAGWRLAYKEDVPTLQENRETLSKNTDVMHSIGLLLAEDGAVSDVVAGSAADKAGVAAGMKLVAVNGRRWNRDHLRRQIRATRTESRPLELLLEAGDFFKTCRLDYNGGERYPVLERDPAQADLLAAILRPAVKTAAAPGPAAAKKKS